MFINAMLRVACDLSTKPLINERQINKDFNKLVSNQTDSAGKWFLSLI